MGLRRAKEIVLLDEPIVGVFITGEDTRTVTAIGAEYLHIVGATYAFLGVFYVVQGGYRGSGSTRLAMGFAVLGFIGLRASLAYGFAVPLDLGATGVWVGVAVANILMVAAVGLYFLRGTWAEHVVTGQARRLTVQSGIKMTQACR